MRLQTHVCDLFIGTRTEIRLQARVQRYFVRVIFLEIVVKYTNNKSIIMMHIYIYIYIQLFCVYVISHAFLDEDKQGRSLLKVASEERLLNYKYA